MSHGASLTDYQQAYKSVSGKDTGLIPPSGLADASNVPIRSGGPESPPASAAEQKRDLGDLLKAINGFNFQTCSCGLKIKMPPDFSQPAFACPRCGHEVRTASPYKPGQSSQTSAR
jgi:heat shock protein HtpX